MMLRFFSICEFCMAAIDYALDFRRNELLRGLLLCESFTVSFNLP